MPAEILSRSSEPRARGREDLGSRPPFFMLASGGVPPWPSTVPGFPSDVCLPYRHCLPLELRPIHRVSAGNPVRADRLEYNARAESMDILHPFTPVEAFQVTSIDAEYRSRCVKYTRVQKRLRLRSRRRSQPRL